MLHIKSCKIKRSFLKKYVVALLLALGVVCFNNAIGAEARTADQKKHYVDQTTVKSVLNLAKFRLLALQDPELALKKIMVESAYQMWELQMKRMDKTIRQSGIRDFFNTSILLVGSQSLELGISAFYSPYVDIILLVQTDNIDEIIKIENFCILPGQIFRGEFKTIQDIPDSIVPQKMSLTSALMKNYSDTEKTFLKINVDGRDFASYVAIAEKHLKYVERNIAIRNYNILSIMDEKNMKKFISMTIFRDILRTNDEDKIKRLSVEKNFSEFSAGYYKIPEVVRKDIVFSYISDYRDGYVLSYMNKIFPRMIVNITVSTDASAKEPIYECFDFGMASDPLTKK